MTLAVSLFAIGGYAETIANPTKRLGAGPLFQIHRGEKWGYMDRAGKTVIEPRFDAERDFFHGLAGVSINGKIGYIDLQGKSIIDPQFDEVRDFLDDLAPVRIGRKWGYIDTTGRMVIQPRFQAAGEFHEGLARVQIWSRVTCTGGVFTDETAPLIALRFFEEQGGDLPSCFPTGHFGFIDKSGSFAIEPRFFAAQDFSEGLAAVRVEENPTGKYGYIDKRGTLVIKPAFNQASRFSQGLAAVETSARTVGNEVVDIAWGYVDHSGALAIPPKYRLAGDFSEGLARVMIQPEGKFGFISRDGTFAIAPVFEIAGDFADGLAIAYTTRRAYIDHSGRAVIKNPGVAWPFSDGLAVRGIYEHRVYIDMRGRTVAPYDIGH